METTAWKQRYHTDTGKKMGMFLSVGDKVDFRTKKIPRRKRDIS